MFKNLFDYFSKSNIRNFLAILIVGGCFVIVLVEHFHKIPADNSSTVNQANGFVLGILGLVVGFYFGSSKKEVDTAAASDNAKTTTTNP